jgi:RHS repeat-associated protein
MTQDPNFNYTYDPENRLLKATRRGGGGGGSALAEAVDSDLSYTTGGDASWQKVSYPAHYGDDSAEGTAWQNGNSWLQTEVEGEGTITFWWKVSSEWDSDYLEFYVDDVRRAYTSGEQDWDDVSVEITGSTTHTLRWQYTKDDDEETGEDDRVWVDYVQWSGQQPQPQEWDQAEYVYDPSGRRIEKKYDGATVYKYIYACPEPAERDGDHCIAEYDASNNVARKYIYGPSVDEPVCMIEAAGDYAGTYYYHFDALGSVVALSDAGGDTVAVYEYDVYGRVGASDPNHPNRFLFTGREFDKETGLYYYRARYYNPQIGRFLQTDPVGYGAGMNWYGYCANNPIGLVDPYGLWASYTFQWVETGGGPYLAVLCLNAGGGVGTDFYFTDWGDLFDYVNGTGKYTTPGDFCDVNFDRAIFNSSLDAAQAADPSYGGATSGGPMSGGPGVNDAPTRIWSEPVDGAGTGSEGLGSPATPNQAGLGPGQFPGPDTSAVRAATEATAPLLRGGFASQEALAAWQRAQTMGFGSTPIKPQAPVGPWAAFFYAFMRITYQVGEIAKGAAEAIDTGVGGALKIVVPSILMPPGLGPTPCTCGTGVPCQRHPWGPRSLGEKPRLPLIDEYTCDECEHKERGRVTNG